jgi:hypothetical protein
MASKVETIILSIREATETKLQNLSACTRKTQHLPISQGGNAWRSASRSCHEGVMLKNEEKQVCVRAQRMAQVLRSPWPTNLVLDLLDILERYYSMYRYVQSMLPDQLDVYAGV